LAATTGVSMDRIGERERPAVSGGSARCSTRVAGLALYLLGQTHAVDRVLVAALGLACLVRPVFLIPFALQSRVIGDQFDYPFETTAAQNVDELLIIALLGIAAVHGSESNRAGDPDPGRGARDPLLHPRQVQAGPLADDPTRQTPAHVVDNVDPAARNRQPDRRD